MYSIDFDKLVSDLLPWFLRKPAMCAWLKSLVAPLVALYDAFLSFRDTKIFEASITGQVAYLEYMLNLLFYREAEVRRILVSDDEAVEEAFVYNAGEDEDGLYLYNATESLSMGSDIYIFNTQEGQNVFDFVVIVPSTLTFDYSYMYSLVSKYKQAGASFKITTYDYIPNE